MTTNTYRESVANAKRYALDWTVNNPEHDQYQLDAVFVQGTFERLIEINHAYALRFAAEELVMAEEAKEYAEKAVKSAATVFVKLDRMARVGVEFDRVVNATEMVTRISTIMVEAAQVESEDGKAVEFEKREIPAINLKVGDVIVGGRHAYTNEYVEFTKPMTVVNEVRGYYEVTLDTFNGSTYSARVVPANLLLTVAM